MTLPRVAVSAQGRPTVSVSVRKRTTVSSVFTRGTQGIQGVQGPLGFASGFGSIDYTDSDSGTPLYLPEGVWTRVARNLTPSLSNGNLPSGPWDSFAFWRDGKLWARASGDGYLIKFAYRVAPEQRGSSLKFGVWPNGEKIFDFAPGPIMIAADAGHEEASSATFYTQARSRFANFGAEIYLLSSSGATLLEFSPEIAPVSFKQ